MSMPIEVTTRPPGNSRRFVHPPLVRWLAMSAVVFCAAACLIVLSLPFLEPAGVSWLLVISSLGVFGAFLYFSVGIVRNSLNTVEVTEEGLWQRSPSGPPLFIRWDEVADVQAQNVMQRLVVMDFTGTRKIRLEYHLHDFGELRRTVLERATRRKADHR